MLGGHYGILLTPHPEYLLNTSFGFVCAPIVGKVKETWKSGTFVYIPTDDPGRAKPVPVITLEISLISHWLDGQLGRNNA